MERKYKVDREDARPAAGSRMSEGLIHEDAPGRSKAGVAATNLGCLRAAREEYQYRLLKIPRWSNLPAAKAAILPVRDALSKRVRRR